MPIKYPKNKQGGTADPSNEAHMLAMSFKGFACMIAEHNVATLEDKAALMARCKPLRKVQADAVEAAERGEFAWRTAIETGGKTILDYWDGTNVIWPPMLTHANTSSKYSFLLYLNHSLDETHDTLTDPAFYNLRQELLNAEQAMVSDDFWVVETVDDVVT